MMHHGAPGTVLLGQVWVSGMGEAGAGGRWVPPAQAQGLPLPRGREQGCHQLCKLLWTGSRCVVELYSVW